MQTRVVSDCDVTVHVLVPTITEFSQGTVLNPDPVMVTSAVAKVMMLLSVPFVLPLETVMSVISGVRQLAKVNSRLEVLADSVAHEESAKVQLPASGPLAGVVSRTVSASMLSSKTADMVATSSSVGPATVTEPDMYTSLPSITSCVE